MPPICAQLCRKRCKERSRGFDQPEENFFGAKDRDTDEAWLAMSDEEMFAAVRSDDNNHFTYTEFLQQRVWNDSDDAKEFFDRFDVNKDGVITIDEMREPDEGEDPNQRPDQRPVLTETGSTEKRDEL
ncbi:uncharacterized protein RSE6_14234 [Rhynchosporium secalis]|uniref:EF-hand domain-containing protein n=1 Tax=Rhynchosporium secalis TaxID=38038 RepID=A0A1E1MUT8_RHYSE|nr:uncharacterized protein RSE6_14234 [Rhynchosporium secalis]